MRRRRVKTGYCGGISRKRGTPATVIVVVSVPIRGSGPQDSSAMQLKVYVVVTNGATGTLPFIGEPGGLMTFPKLSVIPHESKPGAFHVMVDCCVGRIDGGDALIMAEEIVTVLSQATGPMLCDNDVTVTAPVFSHRVE